MINAALPRCLPPCVCVEIRAQNSETAMTGREPHHHQNGANMPFQEGELFRLLFGSRQSLLTGDPTRPAFEVILERPSNEEDGFISPGEAIGIICPNDQSEVEKTLSALGMKGDEILDISSTGNEAAAKRFARQFSYVPKRCTSRHLFTYVVDLRTVLKKVFLRVLGDSCPKESEDQRQLHEMSINSDLYSKNVLEDRLMIFDVLEMFPLCKPSLSILVEYLSRLGPRFYSVANYDRQSVRIIYRPMTFCSRGRMLLGQCSSYFEAMDDLENNLERLSIGQIARPAVMSMNSKNVVCYLRKNIREFSFPPDSSTPFIFICHGTGVAPLEAYLDWLEKSEIRKPDCERWIFYGCRDISKDSLFSEAKARGLGFRIVLKESRVGPARGYIQAAIPGYSSDFVRVVKSSGGLILICGDYNTMAAETLEALKRVLEDENSPELVSDLIKQSRIKLDVWT